MVQYGWATEGKDVVSAFPQQVRGKVFVITGPSTGGIGAETAITLAAESPAQLILLGRSIDKVQPVLDAIVAVNPSIVTKFIQVELESLSSVREAAQKILADSSITQVDGLINNAGIMAVPTLEKTTDGFEKHLAVNHLSHFLLTNLLMPKIVVAPSPRIVNVSSYGHGMTPLRFDDPNFSTEGTYHPWYAYGQSKTANILFTVGLNSKLATAKKSLHAYALDPGSVGTGLIRYITPETRDLLFETFAKHGLIRPESKTPSKGCAGILRAALDPELPEQAGVYLTDTNLTTDPKAIKPYAVDQENAEKLWAISEKWVGDKFDY